ncbi:MAG: hypothetical protein J6I49_09265 [Bacteroidales bacterium]|nr:hypothetical protein [Bacteroidales bacterium]
MTKNRLKRLVLLTAFLLSGLVLSAQLQIPGTNVSYRLNGDDWRYLRTFEHPAGGDIYLYCYVGHVVTDMEGDTVLPFLRIYVTRDYEGDLYELAYERYMEQPYQSLNEYSKGPGLPPSGGLGYIGAYTNPADQKDYQFYMTYFYDKRTSVEFRLETTKDTFEEMDFEFKDILNSIK